METVQSSATPRAPRADRPPRRTGEERDYYALSRRVYRTFAPFYDLSTLPLVRLRREVVETSGADEESKVLDVATGTGAQALAFAGKCREVVGLDLSEAMLRIAERKSRSVPDVRFVVGDATDMPFDDESFDVSCVSFALHEMPRSVRVAALREMVRVTREGGRIVVVDYAPPTSACQRIVHRVVKLYETDQYVDFVRSDLRALLESVGIEVTEEHRVLFGVGTIVTGDRASGRRGADRPRS